MIPKIEAEPSTACVFDQKKREKMAKGCSVESKNENRPVVYEFCEGNPSTDRLIDHVFPPGKEVENRWRLTLS